MIIAPARKPCETREMGQLRKLSRLQHRSSTASEESAGGVWLAPFSVCDPAGKFPPFVVFWVTSRNELVGRAALRPTSDPLGGAVEAFLEAMAEPLVGVPRVPKSVRVSSPELAAALKARLGPAVLVRTGPTPEIDRVHMSADDVEPLAVPLPTTAALRSLFEAAPELHRAAPWAVIGKAGHCLSLSVDAFGIKKAVVVTLGNTRGFCGLLVADIPSAQYVVDRMQEQHEGPIPGMPAFQTLSFERLTRQVRHTTRDRSGLGTRGSRRLAVPEAF